jgi:hypothetical protein
MESREIILTGGRITEGVISVGDTLRRPKGPQTLFVHLLVDHLEDVGFDEENREVLTSIRGRTRNTCGRQL